MIYWFGYIKQLDNNGEAGISLTDRFPENITRFRPELVVDSINEKQFDHDKTPRELVAECILEAC